jgi:hypothetical protein
MRVIEVIATAIMIGVNIGFFGLLAVAGFRRR